MSVSSATRRRARREPLRAADVALAAGEARVVDWPLDTSRPTSTRCATTIEASAAGGPSDRLAVTQQVQPAVPVRTLQATLRALGSRICACRCARPADAAARPRRHRRRSPPPSLGGALEPLRDWLRALSATAAWSSRSSLAVGLGDAGALAATIAAALPSYARRRRAAQVLPDHARGQRGAHRLRAGDQQRRRLDAAGRGAGEDGERPARLRRRQHPARLRRSRAPDLALRKLAAIEALARVGSAEPAMLDSITIEPNLWPTSAVLDWWSILQRVPTIADRDARLRRRRADRARAPQPAGHDDGLLHRARATRSSG